LTIEDASWLTASDNYSLLDKTKALLDSRQFAAAESLAHLTDRTIALRTTGEEAGVWGTIRQDKGGHSSRSFYQTVVTVGVDRTDGISTTGIMANINQGHDSGNKGREKHTQAGFGVYNSLGGEEGLFLDSALSYQRYHQKLTFSPELGALPGNADSNMILMSTRLGFKFKSTRYDVFIEPVVGIEAGYLDDYTLSNNVVNIHQKAGYPVNAVAGFRVGKHWGESMESGITLTAGVLRQQSIGSSAPGVTLSDAYKSREYPSKDDNRYRFDAGMLGKIDGSLSATIFVSSSSGDNFSTDYSGRVGFSYHFR